MPTFENYYLVWFHGVGGNLGREGLDKDFRRILTDDGTQGIWPPPLTGSAINRFPYGNFRLLYSNLADPFFP